MSSPRAFEARIEAGRGGGAFVVVPDTAVRDFGGRKRVRVKATFDGIPYRGTLAWMGGQPMLGVLKSIRTQLDKGIGETIRVTLVEDAEERVVEVPPALAERLKHEPRAQAFFESLSYTARKEYARWITAAKREDTRARRLEQAVEKLKRGEKL